MDGVGAVRLAALGIGVVGLLAAVGSMVRFHGERPLASLSLLLGMAGLGASAAMAVLLPPIAFHTPVLWALLAGGALAGLLADRAVRVRHDPRGVLVRGGAWHLLPAAVALLSLQVAGFAGSLDGVVVATAAIVACAAFAVAAGGLLLARGSIVRLRVAPAAAPAAVGQPGAMPALAAPAAAWSAGALPVSPSAASPPAARPVRATCGACGSPVRAGWRHCVTCGAALAWG